ncbi:MAG: hypothetical protein JEZ00_07995 [Anaerolineaceae bacterium]|nr:hypothetical protein [Anaerolineaceae bacterium]
MDENVISTEQNDENQEPLETAAEVVEAVPSGEEEQSQPVDKRPGWLKRFMAFLFNEDTRLGRFNKSFLRLLVIIIALFATGVLVAYFVLYQPVKNQLVSTTETLRSTTVQLNDTVSTLEEVDAALTDMTTAYDDLVEDYAYATAQNELLRIYGMVVDAQMYIQSKNYIEAKKKLASARNVLDVALPELRKANKADAERLDTRLDLVISEFGNDVKAAESDLDVMVDWVLEFDKLLQGLIDK